MRSVKDVLDIIGLMADKVAEQKDYLTDLDRPIGDSDHGINMARGFEAVAAKLPQWEDKDLGTVLKQVGMTLVSTVGGAAGPLYGTAFMNAGKAMTGKTEADIEDLIVMLDEAVKGVMMRGKSTVGEATMLDAMVPALDAVKAAHSEGKSDEEAISAGVRAAFEGAESTVPMVATKGRASYLGERGIGHKDPGATSFSYILSCIE